MQRMLSTVDKHLLYNIGLNYFMKHVQMEAANKRAKIAANKENDENTRLGFDLAAPKDSQDEAEEGKETKYKDIIAFDGKVSKSSKREETDQTPGQKPLNTLNAYSVGLGSCLGQDFIPEKTNEITSMPILLNNIEIEGAIITCDALNTQTNIVKQIIERGADYVMPIKENKKTLYGDFQVFFDERVIEAMREEGGEESDGRQYLSSQSREQGKKVVREYFLITKFDGLYQAEAWVGLKAIGLARRTVFKVEPKTKEVTTTYEDRYYISSVDTIVQFAQAVRGHWCVENSLHWHLDYTFKDDSNKTTISKGAEGLQVIKKLALTILKVLQAVSPLYTSIKNLRLGLCMLFEKKISILLNLFNPAVINKIKGVF